MGSNPAIEDAAQVDTRQLCLNRNQIVTKSRRRKILMMPRYLSNEISTDRFFLSKNPVLIKTIFSSFGIRCDEEKHFAARFD